MAVVVRSAEDYGSADCLCRQTCRSSGWSTSAGAFRNTKFLSEVTVRTAILVGAIAWILSVAAFDTNCATLVGQEQVQPAIESSGPTSGRTRPEKERDLSAADVFDRRILPILRSERASSCTECHFGGVELKNYIREDQATTFAALRADGLIDLQRPDDSKILQFIRRHTDATDPLIAKMRQAELQAFRDWICAAVQDPTLLAARPSDVKIGSELPAEVIRRMRRDRVLQAFVENIWSEIGRCLNCHSPERNQRQVSEHGEQVSWIVPGNPAGTLDKLVQGGNIDLAHPDQSPVLTKPLGLEQHGGGPKFAVGSRTDKNYRRFLNDYARVVGRGYRRVEELPKPSREIAVLTGQHLRVVNLPEDWDQKLLKVNLYRWTDAGWAETPCGTAESPVNGKNRMWQSMVLAVAPRGSKRAELLQQDRQCRLPGGRYLIKIYIDRHDKIRHDRDYELGEGDLYGQVEISGPWQPGYQPPKIISAPAPGRTSIQE